METYEKVINEIKSFADQEKANHLQRFFKTSKGDYGEGDLFLGLNVPTMRSIAKKHYSSISLDEISKMIKSPYHEERMVALFLMVFIYEKSPAQKTDIFNLYLKSVQYINNWDLVDLSAPKIAGNYIYENKNYDELYKLSNADHLWSNRIAVISTYYFIKRGDFDLILEFSEKFLQHKHDLMQKAVG